MRLCVFYNSKKMGRSANDYVGKGVEWIVCRECQRAIERRGIRLPAVSKLAAAQAEEGEK